MTEYEDVVEELTFCTYTWQTAERFEAGALGPLPVVWTKDHFCGKFQGHEDDHACRACVDERKPVIGKRLRKRISQIERLNNSNTGGNPRYRIFFEDGSSAQTADDAQVNYYVTNSEYQNTDVWVTWDQRGTRVIKVERAQ